MDEIRTWASQLAGETRESTWTRDFYICPEEVRRLAHQIGVRFGGLIGLVGRQGVGKSSALTALSDYLPGMACLPEDKVMFKWRNPPQLYDVFFDPKNPAYEEFLKLYFLVLREELRNPYSRINISENTLRKFNEKVESCIRNEFVACLTVELDWAETVLGTRVVSKLREEVWFGFVESKRVILIDTPDYSKTDKRKMDGDLNEIYWLWNSLTSRQSGANLLVAIQQEMFHDHFFLDKVQIVELKPLPVEQILEIYRRRFKTFYPFHKDAITLLAKMSRGIFRRFLRYLTLTLDLWESKHQENNEIDLIDTSIVKEAVTIERLAADMEVELTALFRNSSDQRKLAVKIMALLQEHGEMKQNELAKQLEVEPYAISRIITRLEDAKYVSHSHDGADKIIKATNPW